MKYLICYNDYLGNVRLSYKNTSNTGVNLQIVEENNYYPFGLKHKGYNNVVNGTENKYQTYQGQELEEELGKDTYAYQWRDYDPAIARFNKIDRFAEKYHDTSPYAFVKNNPIRYREIAGDSLWINSSDGNLLYKDNKLFKQNDSGSFDLYKGKLAKLDKDGNVKRYKGSLGSVVNSLNKLDTKSDYASSLISTLQESEYKFTIKTGSKEVNRFAPFYGSEGKTAVMTNNTYANQVLSQGEKVISQFPFNQIGGGGEIKLNSSFSTIELAHEIGHAYDGNFGLLDSRRVPINGGFEEVREIRAVYHENRVRQDLKMRLRPNYSGRPSLLNKQKQPVFYQNRYPFPIGLKMF